MVSTWLSRILLWFHFRGNFALGRALRDPIQIILYHLCGILRQMQVFLFQAFVILSVDVIPGCNDKLIKPSSLKLRSTYFSNRTPCSTNSLPTKLLLTHILFNHPFHRHNHLHFHRTSLHYPNHQPPTPTTNIHQSRRLIPPKWCITLRTTSRGSSSTLCANFTWNNDLFMVPLELPQSTTYLFMSHPLFHHNQVPTLSVLPFLDANPTHQRPLGITAPAPTCHQRLCCLFLCQWPITHHHRNHSFCNPFCVFYPLQCNQCLCVQHPHQ